MPNKKPRVVSCSSASRCILQLSPLTAQGSWDKRTCLSPETNCGPETKTTFYSHHFHTLWRLCLVYVKALWSHWVDSPFPSD